MAEITEPRAPTREELLEFLPNPRTRRAFEKLFDVVPAEFNTELALIQETVVDTGVVDTKSIQAIGELTKAANQLKSTQVLLWLSM